MVELGTDNQMTPRSRQRGFLLNPFRFGGGVPAPTPILDLYPGAEAAWSLRKLRSAYTGPAIKVRRSSDNTTLDIGFNSSGSLDESSLLSFVGSGDGYVTNWYDQSGNTHNAVAVLATYEPLIVQAGVVKKLNMRPCLTFDGSNDYFSVPGFSTGQLFSCFAAGFTKKGDTSTFMSGNLGSPQFRIRDVDGNNCTVQIVRTSQLGLADSAPFTGDVVAQCTYMTTSTSTQTRKNGGNLGTAGAPNFSSEINRIGIHGYSGGECFTGGMHEIVLYTSDKSSDRAAIETNQMDYYSIV